VNGVDCQTVIYQSPAFGQVQATIGVKDHLVRKVVYDGAPLLAKAGAMKAWEFAKPVPSPAPQSLPVTESYDTSVLDSAIPDSTFETRVPETLPPLQLPGQPSSRQVAQGGGAGQDDDAGQGTDGLPVGSVAPDITVTDVRSGQSMKLSSLKGHPVMIDFWATWCPPCRMSLPLTQKFAKQYGPQGLQVMAISDEDRTTISKFLDQNHYTFPTYRDADQSATMAYHVTGIPAIFVIDKDGKVKHYQAGYGGPEPEEEALKQVGFGA
jgi:thiol-disulfide isomerase/thioredoxin